MGAHVERLPGGAVVLFLAVQTDFSKSGFGRAADGFTPRVVLNKGRNGCIILIYLLNSLDISLSV